MAGVRIVSPLGTEDDRDLLQNRPGRTRLVKRRLARAAHEPTVRARSGRCLVRKRPRRCRGLCVQARQDLNLQPPVLETGALPIELRAYEGRYSGIQLSRHALKERTALPPFRLTARRGWLRGLEPPTSGATVRRSNRLSYNHHGTDQVSSSHTALPPCRLTARRGFPT